MAVYFSPQVRNGIVQYWRSLSSYGISYTRAVEKYREMEDALLSLTDVVYRRICPFKDLGQVLMRTGRPLFPFLYIFVYADRKSKSKWSFSYVIDTTGDLFVLTMKYSKFVKEQSGDNNLPNSISSCKTTLLNETKKSNRMKIININDYKRNSIINESLNPLGDYDYRSKEYVYLEIIELMIKEQHRRGNASFSESDIKRGEYYPIGQVKYDGKHSSISSIIMPNGGQTYHICEDDHCIVIRMTNDGPFSEDYIYVNWIFPALFEELKRIDVSVLY